MDFCSQPGLMPIADAIARMQQAIHPITAIECVPISAALDRVLAEAIYSGIDVPGHNNSAMDGYALNDADANLQQPLRVIGTSLAGHPFLGSILPGECVRITTGAVVPTNATTVIMQEQTTLLNEKIQINKIPRNGENIRHAGEDIAVGTRVLEQGKRINPIDIGLLASLGIAQVNVFKRVRVSVLSTGDELKPLGQPLQPGEVYDSNRPTLVALLTRLNVEIIDVGLITDDPIKIAAAFQYAIAQADVVISTGGVSVGDADYTKDVLEKLGTINFWKVAMKPGKPFAFGTLGTPNPIENLQKNKNISNTNDIPQNRSWFFGLPGNPVSAVVTYHQLVLPALRYLAGEKLDASLELTATSQTDLKKQPGRTDYQRGILKNIDGNNQVGSTGNQSSGVLSSIAQANCYIVLEQERDSVLRGEKVTVIPFDKFLT